MFVLPPPPSRAIHASIYGSTPGGPPLIETSNVITRPEGAEHQLVAGEGTYTLAYNLHLATPPPHPSEAPQPNNNPLATNIGPPIAGTRLCLPGLSSRKPPSRGLFRFGAANSARAAIPSIQEEAQSPKSDAGSGFGTASYYSQPAAVPTFGDGNPALVSAPQKGNRGKDGKAKPKNNIVKSNSSFVSRVIPHEALTKRLAERSADAMFAFANVNRAFLWLDLSAEAKTENLTKVLFTRAHVLCHDVNPTTKAASHVDVAMGFNSSDIIWYEPMSQKYTRINKNGAINPTPVSAIAWVPNKENLFVAAHFDGTLVVYDKEKEDAAFVVDEAGAGMENGTSDGQTNGETNGTAQHHRARRGFRVYKSVQSREQKTNPVAAWKLSTMKVNSIAFSPDGQLLAVVSDDGTLTVLDYLRERVLDVHRSYYGGLLCVTWSPDGRYVLTGGQDDLVSVWSIPERQLVARCVGHQSWVTDVRFDAWRCDERTYRFGSVGHDRQLLLWDFSVGMLGRARALSSRNLGSVAGSGPMGSIAGPGGAGGHRDSISTVARIRSNSTRAGGGASTADDDGDDDADAEAEMDVVHAVDPKAGTPVLPPVMAKSVDEHALCWLGFEEHCILTGCIDGDVREFERPKEG